MIDTTFSGLVRSLTLVDGDEETPFTALPTRRKTGPLRTLQKIDAMTANLDEALAEALEERWYLTPLSIEPGWLPVPRSSSEDRAASVARRDRVLGAIADIRSTLGISDAATARLIGVARNTLASWRKGERDPYPATVRRLFEIHSIVSAASTLFGDNASAWFHEYVDASTRLGILASETGAAQIAAELRRMLFTVVGTHTLPALDDDDDEIETIDGAFVPDAFSGAIRPRRRVT